MEQTCALLSQFNLDEDFVALPIYAAMPFAAQCEILQRSENGNSTGTSIVKKRFSLGRSQASRPTTTPRWRSSVAKGESLLLPISQRLPSPSTASSSSLTQAGFDFKIKGFYDLHFSISGLFKESIYNHDIETLKVTSISRAQVTIRVFSPFLFGLTILN